MANHTVHPPEPFSSEQLARENAALREEVHRLRARLEAAEQAQRGQQARIAALEESEHRLQAIIDASTAIIYVKDLQGRYTLVNRAWSDLFGAPREAVLGRTDTEFFRTREAGQYAVNDQLVLEAGTSMPFEEVAEIDGEWVTYLSVKFPLRDSTGAVYALGGISSDITGLKRAEAALRRSETQLRVLNETLEQRVRERTAELERSNSELDQFAYVASHDLKAPLRAIHTLAAWIQEDAGELLPEASRVHLEKLRGRVTRMEGLLNDLLSYSRLDRQRYEIDQVDTRRLVRGVGEMLVLPEGFVVEVEEPMPVIRTARIPLELVLRNLIGNAVKHHHRKEGTVRVAAREDDALVEFAVADDGPGIPEAFQERIFGMFQVLQPRDRVEGSGMGLALAKKAVESRGGRIWVESAEGCGATFRFTWPKEAGEETVP